MRQISASGLCQWWASSLLQQDMNWVCFLNLKYPSYLAKVLRSLAAGFYQFSFSPLPSSMQGAGEIKIYNRFFPRWFNSLAQGSANCSVLRPKFTNIPLSCCRLYFNDESQYSVCFQPKRQIAWYFLFQDKLFWAFIFPLKAFLVRLQPKAASPARHNRKTKGRTYAMICLPRTHH